MVDCCECCTCDNFVDLWLNELSDLEDDGSPDIAEYNRVLFDMGKLTWLNCPWLFGECYLYR